MKTYCCTRVFTVVPCTTASYLKGVPRANLCACAPRGISQCARYQCHSLGATFSTAGVMVAENMSVCRRAGGGIASNIVSRSGKMVESSRRSA